MPNIQNNLYPSASLNLLKGNFHFCDYGPRNNENQSASGTYAVLLQDAGTPGYSFYRKQDQTYQDILTGSGAPGWFITASQPVQMGNVVCSAGTYPFTAGCLDADPVVFPNVPVLTSSPTAVVNAVVIFQSSSVPETDYLFAYFGTSSLGSAISILPNGGDITVNWNASGITCLSGGCP